MAVETSRPFPICSGISRVVAIPSPPENQINFITAPVPFLFSPYCHGLSAARHVCSSCHGRKAFHFAPGRVPAVSVSIVPGNPNLTYVIHISDSSAGASGHRSIRVVHVLQQNPGIRRVGLTYKLHLVTAHKFLFHLEILPGLSKK